MDEASEHEIRTSLQAFGNDLAREQVDKWPDAILEWSKREVVDSTVDDVLVQLFGLDLIAHGKKKRTMSDHNRYWVLTPAGQDQVMRLRALRRPSQFELHGWREAELRGMTVPQLRAIAREHELDARKVKAESVRSILIAEGYESD